MSNLYRLSLLVVFVCVSVVCLSRAQTLVDDFESTEAWYPIESPGAELKLSRVSNDHYAALCMAYDLGNAERYVIAVRDADLALPENFEFRFPIKGTGERNNLEFKLIDEEGNTFLRVWRNFRPPSEWTDVWVKRRELGWGWGPDRHAALDYADRIEFALVSGRGEEGKVMVGPITLHELEPVPAEALPSAKASSRDNDDHPPRDAVDSSYATSWRSRPFDPQWIEVDFKEPRTMVGLRLYWGLYGDYDIYLARETNDWQRVYRQADADGGMDELFFNTTTARYLRIETRKQAHRDGYQLFEIETLGPDVRPLVKASSSREAHPAENILDGKMKTEWHSEEDGRQWIELDLRGSKAWGGLTIHWGNDRAKTYDVEVSTNGLNWWPVYTARGEAGRKHEIFLEETEARFLRVLCQPNGNAKAYAVRRVDLKAPEESMTTTRFYRLAAEANPGCYPRWLLNEQAYWTMVGTPEDVKEAMICEDGTLEPHKRGFTIMPVLRLNDKLVTREQASVSQSLLDDCLPIPSVHWIHQNLKMDITTLAHGGGASSMYARYRLSNTGRQSLTGSLYLVVHPMQVYPPWQGGHDGFSAIKELSYSNGVTELDGGRVLLFLTPPDQFAAKGGTYQVGQPVEGDIADDVARGTLPDTQTAEDPEGFASGAAEFRFRLEPGDDREFYVGIPLHATLPYLNPAMDEAAIVDAFNEMHAETAAYWREAVNRVTFDVPDRALMNTLKANVAYNLITKDGPGFEPGSRSYDKAWMRDGSVAAIALLKMGFTEEIRDFIEWFAAYQFENGEIPPIIDNKHIHPLWEEEQQDLHEFDSQGQFVHLVYEYYRYTGDEAFLEKMYPRVMGALRFLQQLRQQRATEEYRDDPEKQIFYNILPPSRSHEGYWLAHSYWDDFWALKGWKDGVGIAEAMGKADDVAWMQEEYETLKTGFYESIDRVMEKYGINYVPGCADKGDFDATSTAAGIVFCDELENMPQPATANTFDRFYEDLEGRFEAGAQYVFTPYEVRTVLAFLFMGQKDRALNLLDFLIASRRPADWCHLAEVVHSGYRFPCYIGDMPHTWVGAGVINSIRGLFFYEDGEKLVVGAGVKPEWVAEGKRIHIADAPTRYGKVNLEMHREATAVLIDLSGAAAPADGFDVHAPFDAPITSATVNGEEHPVAGDTIHVTTLPAKIVLNP